MLGHLNRAAGQRRQMSTKRYSQAEQWQTAKPYRNAVRRCIGSPKTDIEVNLFSQRGYLVEVGHHHFRHDRDDCPKACGRQPASHLGNPDAIDDIRRATIDQCHLLLASPGPMETKGKDEHHTRNSCYGVDHRYRSQRMPLVANNKGLSQRPPTLRSKAGAPSTNSCIEWYNQLAAYSQPSPPSAVHVGARGKQRQEKRNRQRRNENAGGDGQRIEDCSVKFKPAHRNLFHLALATKNMVVMLSEAVRLVAYIL